MKFTSFAQDFFDMNIIDTHTHIYLEQFDDDRSEIINRAFEKGVSRFYLPNIDASSIAKIDALVEQHDSCYPMLGIHPCSVEADPEKQWAAMKQVWKSKPNNYYVAVGEIGIDLYWDQSLIKEQQWAFTEQIRFAKEHKKPIVIHCRDAFDEVLEIMDRENEDDLFGIFHCFTGTEEHAKQILNYGGFKLGIGGVVTFKNGGLDKVVSQLNLEDLVVETDAPFLAPAPNRGKRNEPSYIYNVVDKLSDIFECSVTEVAETTTENALKIYHGQ